MLEARLCWGRWAETVRRYANTPGLRDDLRRDSGRIRKAAGNRLTRDYPAQSRRFTLDQLSDVKADQLVTKFEAGVPKTKLAAEFGLSRSSVQRLLRQHRRRR